jgi:hypothetical protein
MKHMFRFGIAAVIITLAFIAGRNLSSHPTDQVMEQKLKSHEVQFNRLVEMFFEDWDIVRLSNENVFFDEGVNRNVPNERLNEYRCLFKELEIEAGMYRDGANAIRLIASSRGLFLATSEKSYVYSKFETSPLVDSLDKIIAKSRGDQSPVYRKLGGNWYLYYESW